MYDNMSANLELYTETRITADGAAAVEALRAKLFLAKEQARMSNSATNKAADELKPNRLLGTSVRREFLSWRAR